ncbi:AbfB domain-containing protein [Streptomyces sp. TRM68367]|uniref:AbfB domain-containing protein n=1 Tax=Streptomyces sp. TRM68367 TaxID=2758415 RepID=UPI00165B4658|nr:AbfB domain-containing protein [Streptomyces sp. TRM68367]MBC9724734.1 AbfB domain-containing protein [Streptomyces sp. TRM68367]
MPENKPRPPLDEPWENGWAPDTSRAPGTRRLWLAGVLALVTVTACITAITVMDRKSGERSQATPAESVNTTVPGLISFGTPSKSGEPISHKHSRPSPHPSKTTPPAPTTPEPRPKAPKSPAPDRTSPAPNRPPASAPSTTSVRAVNYPDRYWHLSDGYVLLDRIGSGPEQREDATFQRVKGLADSSCYSFRTSDGGYLRHRSFVLREDSDDGSALFRQDATFCPRSSSYSGAIMLESVNYPGRFLRHRNFQLRLDRYEYSDVYRADSAFRMVDGLA